MSEPLAHLYALALRALDEQERRAEAMRGRLGPVLAAAALGVSLIGGPVPVLASLTRALAFTIAASGLVVALAAMRVLLRDRHHMRSELSVHELIHGLQAKGALDDLDAFYTTMIARLSEQRRDNDALLDHLATTFTAMVCGILAILCGLALAAIVG